jgi:NADH-quinone oxidoreductase subunit H
MQTIFESPLFLPLAIMLVIVGAFPLVVGYIVLLERKVLADMQVRLGPHRVGPFGFLQPIADALKLLLKEDVIPSAADKWIFWMAPVISMFTAFTAFSVLPFSRNIYITD